MTYATEQLTRTEQHRTWIAIERNGGGFCQLLAQAWFYGDSFHKARLNDAFEHLLTKYGPGSTFYINRAL